MGNILDSVIEISKYPGIMRSCERYNNYNPNNITDQRIFAKAVAISEDRPVTILTKDNDFQRIQSTFYSRIFHLAKKHNFPIPNHDVNILFGDRSNEYFLHNPTLGKKNWKSDGKLLIG